MEIMSAGITAGSMREPFDSDSIPNSIREIFDRDRNPHNNLDDKMFVHVKLNTCLLLDELFLLSKHWS